MLIFIFVAFLSLNFLLAFREKTVDFVSVATMLFLWFVITGSRSSFDLFYYIQGYDNIMKLDVDIQITFYYLRKIFHCLNFSFFEFRSFVVAVSLFFMYFFFRKTSLNIHLTCASYMLYLIFLDYIQFRNFFAASIFYVALTILLYQGKNWKIWYTLFIILASTIHSSFWIYLIFLLTPSIEWNNAKIVKTIAVTTLFFSIVSVFSRNFLSGTADLVSIIDGEKSVRYANSSTNYGGLYYIFLHMFSTISIGLLLQQSKKNGTNFFINGYNNLIDSRKYLQLIFYVNLLAFTFCPLIVFSITFYRLLRNLYLLNIIGFSLFCIKNKPLWFYFLLILYIFLWVGVELTGARFNHLVMPLFESNVYL